MQDEWTELLVTYDSSEAAMIRDLLESGGIPVKVSSAKVTPYPVNVGRMGEVKLFVRRQDLETAGQAVRQFRRPDADEE